MALVYSTDLGKTCPQCKQALSSCRCNKDLIYEKSDCLIISRETKGRKGKGVTLIKGIGGNEKELRDFAKILKQQCNSGGTVKDGVIEIQGDHRDSLKDFLIKKNFQVKISGS